MPSIASEISKNLAFRYRISCPRLDARPERLFELPDSCSVPAFHDFDRQNSFADVRIGWMDDGLYVSAVITSKQQSVWCRETQLLDSDGLQLWIDTRATHNVHRASKFCHWLMLLPAGGGSDSKSPLMTMLKINRSQNDPPTMNKAKLEAFSKINKDGYQISAFIPGTVLFGWDAAEHRQLGFNYAVADRELGWQTLALGPDLPIDQDPSLWQTMLLTEG